MGSREWFRRHWTSLYATGIGLSVRRLTEGESSWWHRLGGKYSVEGFPGMQVVVVVSDVVGACRHGRGESLFPDGV